jgi:VWFA-related protein
MRHLFGALLVALTLAPLAAPPPSQPPFRGRAELVRVPVIVTDRDGAIVSDLTADDFEIREDGVVVPIATFGAPTTVGNTPARSRRRSTESGRFIVLVLDNLFASPTRTTRIKSIARRFAQKMTPEDVMAVIPIDGGAATTSRRPEDALKSIEAFKPRGGAHTSEELAGLIRHALTMLGDLTTHLAGVANARKVLVYVGAPFLFYPTEQSAMFSDEWFTAVRTALRANVTIYVMNPYGMTGEPDAGAIDFAEETGGKAFVNSNFFDRDIDTIWSEAAGYYLIGYQPPERSRGKRSADGHAIDVRVKRPGVHVSARRRRF